MKESDAERGDIELAGGLTVVRSRPGWITSMRISSDSRSLGVSYGLAQQADGAFHVHEPDRAPTRARGALTPDAPSRSCAGSTSLCRSAYFGSEVSRAAGTESFGILDTRGNPRASAAVPTWNHTRAFGMLRLDKPIEGLLPHATQMLTFRTLIGVVMVVFSASCRFAAEHTSGEAWRDAGAGLLRHSEQWVPIAITVGATPIAFLEDQTTSGDAVEDQSLATDTSLGDTLSIALGLVPIALGGGIAVGTGDTRYFEATTEAVLLTALETQFLKLAANRERPDGSTEDSFPSGHTSFAFGGATLLARWWGQTHEGSKLGYWLYVPAAYVGASRLEGDRHYISDITFGAALGIATAHLVWNLHFGDAEDEGLYGRRLQTAVSPLVAPDRVGVSLSFAF